MTTINNAPNGEKTTPVVTDTVPLGDDHYAQLQNLLKIVNGLTEDTSPDSSSDYVLSYDASASEPKKVLMKRVDATKRIRGTVANPNGYYTNIRAQIPIFRTDAAITITRIHIHGADTTPTSEMALDLKFADDLNTGGFANAAVIDVCDTTNGVVTITSGFDDATVPSGKYIYWSLDAAPHTDWKDFYFEIYFTYD